jgi:cytidylate kinase
MKSKARSIERIIEEQVQKWQMSRMEKPEKQTLRPVITISRDPGSGGRILAQALAKRRGLDLFHQELLNDMAKSAKVSAQFLATLDEKGLSVLQNWIRSMLHERHIWPDEYLQHLLKVIGTIGKHGNAVVVGRGANFILPPDGRLRIRMIAPLAVRIANVSGTYGVSPEEAQGRIIRTESDRRAFIRKYFNADITDPKNYDIILNMEYLTIEAAADIVNAALQRMARSSKGLKAA